MWSKSVDSINFDSTFVLFLRQSKLFFDCYLFHLLEFEINYQHFGIRSPKHLEPIQIPADCVTIWVAVFKVTPNESRQSGKACACERKTSISAVAGVVYVSLTCYSTLLANKMTVAVEEILAHLARVHDEQQKENKVIQFETDREAILVYIDRTRHIRSAHLV